MSFSVWNQIYGKLSILIDSIIETNLPMRKYEIENKLAYHEEEEDEDASPVNKIQVIECYETEEFEEIDE